jgi:hypothetical protein
MGELSQRAEWVRVDFNQAQADIVWNTVEVVPLTPEPGVSQNDAVQMVCELAMLRDLVAAPMCARFAVYGGSDPTLEGFYDECGYNQIFQALNKVSNSGASVVHMYGDAPLTDPAMFRSSNPTSKWGMKLALALDQSMVLLSRSMQDAQEQAQVLQGFAPQAIIAAIIVTGAAVAVIGSIAAWRYLDPQWRTDSLLVRQAAEDYGARLTAWQATGTMPPPSETEKTAVPTVERLGAARSGTDWGMGAAVGGGFLVGTVILGILGNRAGKATNPRRRYA